MHQYHPQKKDPHKTTTDGHVELGYLTPTNEPNFDLDLDYVASLHSRQQYFPFPNELAQPLGDFSTDTEKKSASSDLGSDSGSDSSKSSQRNTLRVLMPNPNREVFEEVRAALTTAAGRSTSRCKSVLWNGSNVFYTAGQTCSIANAIHYLSAFLTGNKVDLDPIDAFGIAIPVAGILLFAPLSYQYLKNRDTGPSTLREVLCKNLTLTVGQFIGNLVLSTLFFFSFYNSIKAIFWADCPENYAGLWIAKILALMNFFISLFANMWIGNFKLIQKISPAVQLKRLKLTFENMFSCKNLWPSKQADCLSSCSPAAKKIWYAVLNLLALPFRLIPLGLLLSYMVCSLLIQFATGCSVLDQAANEILRLNTSVHDGFNTTTWDHSLCNASLTVAETAQPIDDYDPAIRLLIYSPMVLFFLALCHGPLYYLPTIYRLNDFNNGIHNILDDVPKAFRSGCGKLWNCPFLFFFLFSVVTISSNTWLAYVKVIYTTLSAELPSENRAYNENGSLLNTTDLFENTTLTYQPCSIGIDLWNACVLFWTILSALTEFQQLVICRAMSVFAVSSAIFLRIFKGKALPTDEETDMGMRNLMGMGNRGFSM